MYLSAKTGRHECDDEIRISYGNVCGLSHELSSSSWFSKTSIIPIASFRGNMCSPTSKAEYKFQAFKNNVL